MGEVNEMKRFLLVGGILVAVIIIIPTMLVVIFSKDEPGLSAYTLGNGNNEMNGTEQHKNNQTDGPIVSVYRTKLKKIEEVPFEDYIVGVVAREMPATFEMEALKAQALTARTYILNLLMFGNDMKTPDGADVTDTEDHQVFFNDEELLEHWGEDYEWKMARVRQAVYETSGEVITYEGRPITATFFSTSNGYTENSEEYWQNEIPYLRSVESPWDVDSPRYKGQKQFTREEIENALNISFEDGGIKVLSRTTGGRVANISIGGKEFTGREVRELLGLDSADFTFSLDGDKIIVETHGWGHGVGMSQYGADGMAKEGYTYIDIIHHYYQNVEIMDASQFLGDISFANDLNYAEEETKEVSTSGEKEKKDS